MEDIALRRSWSFSLFACIFLSSILCLPVETEDPSKALTWNVAYGDTSPFGVKQRVILINDQFPGPQIEAVTNERLTVSIFNGLPEPFHISWKGIQLRKSPGHGFSCSNCPIPPGKNLTYLLEMKNVTGSYYYYPSLNLHKAAGGYAGIKILDHPGQPLPFDSPSGDFSLLAGDWFKHDHSALKGMLDSGKELPFPGGLLINGRGWNGYTFTVDQGKTYRFRVSNVGLTQSINIRFEGHTMQLVEVEGTYTLQNSYTTLDVHLGQSYSVLVKADQLVRDYYIAVSSRFTSSLLTTTAVLHYSGSTPKAQGMPRRGPTIQVDYSFALARSIRLNLTSSGGKPTPQGSYRYGRIKTNRTIDLSNTRLVIDEKPRYAVNGLSFNSSETYMKIGDYYLLPGPFTFDKIPEEPSVISTNFQEFVEIVFENQESTLQSWYIEGYIFFVVGMDRGKWSSTSRKRYNLEDAIALSTVQVYPNSWTAVYMALENVGTWKIRPENWERQYLGQQVFLRVYCPFTGEALFTPYGDLCVSSRGPWTRPI